MSMDRIDVTLSPGGTARIGLRPGEARTITIDPWQGYGNKPKYIEVYAEKEATTAFRDRIVNVVAVIFLVFPLMTAAALALVWACIWIAMKIGDLL
jgi:hypothetical protein